MQSKTLSPKEKLLASHAQELAKLEAEESIRAALPEQYRTDATICIHDTKKPHASVKLWNDFRTEKKLADALPVLESYKDQIIDGEHWKDGCVSTWPPQINSCIENANAVMDGSHAVEINVSGGRSYGPTVELNFWVMLGGWLCEIALPVCDLRKLTPNVHATYNRSGEVCKCEITWPVERQTADKFRTFWSEKPAYNGSYYLADYPNFLAFVSNFTAKEIA